MVSEPLILGLLQAVPLALLARGSSCPSRSSPVTSPDAPSLTTSTGSSKLAPTPSDAPTLRKVSPPSAAQCRCKGAQVAQEGLRVLQRHCLHRYFAQRRLKTLPSKCECCSWQPLSGLSMRSPVRPPARRPRYSRRARVCARPHCRPHAHPRESKRIPSRTPGCEITCTLARSCACPHRVHREGAWPLVKPGCPRICSAAVATASRPMRSRSKTTFLHAMKIAAEGHASANRPDEWRRLLPHRSYQR